MAKNTPEVRRNKLYPDAYPTAQSLCAVDSPEWFIWLASATKFRFYTTQRTPVTHTYSRPMRPISLRKEKRRQGFLWYANLRIHGTLYKRYVGRSDALTTQRLDHIAILLNELG